VSEEYLPAMETALRGRAVDAVERACATSKSADELLERLAAEVHRYVPHDAAMWFGVDPVTMIATEPSRVEGMDAAYCDTFWHLEFHEQDTALFADLAAGDTVAAMRQSLDDRPARSIRYRDFMRPQGFGDELRGAFRAGPRTWGVVGLYRDAGRRPFDAAEVDFVRAIGEPVARALRTHVRATSPWLGQPSAPGLVVVDRHGRTVSANAEAMCWLRDLWPELPDPDDGTGTASPDARQSRDGLLDVPTALIALVARARAVAEGRERVPARLRLRDRRGRWIVLHASALAGPASPDGSVAVVIEAAKSAEIAPIVIDAYSLTPREREVLGAIARGGSTGEIAAELFLSPHTVRDHVKTVFEKVGVSSRGELVARLFGEHYSDRLHDTMIHSH
jgi:DNA-binding CsgD family transcriptional regulator